MTPHYADAIARDPYSPLLSWSLPSAAIIAAVVGSVFIAAALGLSRSGDADAVTAPETPSIGSIMGASPAIGERPFTDLEFDWHPASGVPGFGPLHESQPVVGDASAG